MRAGRVERWAWRNGAWRFLVGLCLLVSSSCTLAQTPADEFKKILPAIELLLSDDGPEVYNIFADHLNTPRLVTRGDATQQVMWKWDNDDAFGANAPNENPAGAGTFVMNLRLSGQYFDAETGRHYNYFRDYDPAIGRYVQSDPIGLGGGINTYAYTNGNPLSFADPLGLYTTVVCRPVNDWKARFVGAKHCFVVVWHWSEQCPLPILVIDRQYSLAGNPTPFPQNSNAPTFRDDRNTWNSGTGNYYDIAPPIGQSVSDFDTNVMRQGDSYNSGNGYSANGQTGPNSNTATQQIIQGAGGVVPSIPGAYGQYYKR